MITPVILCGGSGTRLWPLSRKSYPKQLLPLIGDKSLLQQTLLRIRDFPGVTQPIILCNQDYRFIVAEQLRDIEFFNSSIILEPEGKNTAPAVTLAALHLQKQNLQEKNKDTLILVLPVDHIINNQAQFFTAIHQAVKIAHQGLLVTFGVVPTNPATAYGYIQKGQQLDDDAFRVVKFVEKPDRTSAKKYLNSGDYLWNSGMFLFQIETFLNEMRQYAPDILESCYHCAKEMQADLDFYRIKSELFHACRSDSIDYAVMEKSPHIALVPLHSDWSDIGSWNSLCDIQKKINLENDLGNVVKGDVVVHHVYNSYLRADSRLLAAVGVSDLIIVETADAVLVTNKENCQHVKELVDILKTRKRPEVERHPLDYRPWGYYEILESGQAFQAKRLVIKPGGKLSLQTHQYRSEHWVIVKGVAFVTCGEKCFELRENQSTFIPAGMKHRLENRENVSLELIEVQTGSYFGEDDIVRYEDVYHRSET